MLLTYSIIITGKVQGVFYRQSAKEKATALAITGTVKNNDDDSVGIVATGTKEQLDQFVEWCKEGPPKAQVEHIQVKEVPLQDFRNFTITRW